MIGLLKRSRKIYFFGNAVHAMHYDEDKLADLYVWCTHHSALWDETTHRGRAPVLNASFRPFIPEAPTRHGNLWSASRAMSRVPEHASSARHSRRNNLLNFFSSWDRALGRRVHGTDKSFLWRTANARIVKGNRNGEKASAATPRREQHPFRTGAEILRVQAYVLRHTDGRGTPYPRKLLISNSKLMNF